MPTKTSREAAMDAKGKSKVLIAGGGVAALEAALALRELAADRVSVELLAPEPRFWYRPLAVAEPFQLGDVVHHELDSLTLAIGASFTPGALTGIDEWRHVAYTSTNTEIPYDRLLVACGAVPTLVPGALTFRGPADTAAVESLLAEVARGEVRSIAFVIPWGAVWSLPAYELALLTALYVHEKGIGAVRIQIVTPEQEPLQLFGPAASKAMHDLLSQRQITLVSGSYPSEVVDGELRLLPTGTVAADRFVALPRLHGAPIDGLPQTVNGFVPVDAHCRVHGLPEIYAAGDITNFTVKQGGIATQQADVAAQAIAAAAGADVTPERFRPVLRGLLLTGREPRYLRRELSGRPEQEPLASSEPVWWPPAKIVGRYLAPFLASISEVESPADLPEAVSGALSIEVELDHAQGPELVAEELASGLDETDERVRAFMSNAVAVAPEDTLGEVAERMLEMDAGAVVVVDYGRVIGILTRHDLVRAYAARVHPSEGRVRQWMTAEPVTVSPETSPRVALTLMREYAIHHLLVADGERPVGLVHIDDVPQDLPVPVGLGF
jgi:sulfide:quinone oxidoreductase